MAVSEGISNLSFLIKYSGATKQAVEKSIYAKDAKDTKSKTKFSSKEEEEKGGLFKGSLVDFDAGDR